MPITCPHCNSPIDVADQVPDDVLCPSCGSSVRVHDTMQTMTQARASRIGKFELYERVGVGAFGTVWRARDTELDRTVALKLMHASMIAASADRARFIREARAAAQLRHPSIVTVHEVTELEGVPAIVADFVEGVTLRELLETRKLTFREAAELAAQVADALDYAHSLKVVHRDIKPANIMIEFPRGEGTGMSLDPAEMSASHVSTSSSGSQWSSRSSGTSRPRALLLDFGLALRDEAELTLTADGQIIGTPAYMSPEQAAGFGHKVDGRSDTYSLGVVLYELLCGELPFRGSKVMMVNQVIHKDPQAPRRINERIPHDMETICLKAMAKDAGQRYATAAELANDLRRFLNGEAIQARPVGGIEKAWKWAKRQPALAGLLATGLVAALALVGLGVGAFYSVRLSRAFQLAESARVAAETARMAEAAERQRTEAARGQAEQFLYFNRIVLAEHEWRANNVWRAEQLLDSSPTNLRGWEWHYLKRLCRAELHTFRGHSAPVDRIAVSPDGQLIASASNDKTIKLWNLANRLETRTLTGHTRNVEGLSFSPDGRRLVSSAGAFGHPGEVIIWDVESGSELQRIRDVGGNKCRVTFAPDGKRVAIASGDWDRPRFVKVLDANTAQELVAIPIAEKAPVCVAFNHDGTQLAAGIGTWNVFDQERRPGVVHVWDSTTGAELFTLRGHTAPVTAIAFSPDGRELASTGWDLVARIWDIENRRERIRLLGHKNLVSGIAFSRDGKRIATGSEDGSAKVWDASTGQELLTMRGHAGGVPSVAFNADGAQLITAGDDGTVKLWDATVGPEATLLGKFGSIVNCVVFSPDARWIVAGAVERRITVWNADHGGVQLDLPDLQNSVWSARFSPDSRRIALGLGDWSKPDQPAYAKILDAMTGREYHTLRGHMGLVWSVAFSPDGQQLATAGGELGTPDSVKVWQVSTGAELVSFPNPNGGIPAVEFSSDGRLLAAAIGSTIQLWDTSNWSERTLLQGHSGLVFQLAFSPDSSQIASCGVDRTVRLWDIATSKLVHELTHAHYVSCVSFSPDGSRIVSGSFDHTIKLWDRTTGQEILTLRGHAGAVSWLAFSPDGQRLVSSSHDRTVKIWDTIPRRGQ